MLSVYQLWNHPTEEEIIDWAAQVDFKYNGSDSELNPFEG